MAVKFFKFMHFVEKDVELFGGSILAVLGNFLKSQAS